MGYRNDRRSQPPALYNERRLYERPIPNIDAHAGDNANENRNQLALLENVHVEARNENEGEDRDNESDAMNISNDENAAAIEEVLFDSLQQNNTAASVQNNSSDGDPLQISAEGTVKIEEIPPIVMRNAEQLENLMREANRAAPSTSQAARDAGPSTSQAVRDTNCNQQNDTDDIIWLSEPPRPLKMPNYNLVKRDGDAFSGNLAYRELVNIL